MGRGAVLLGLVIGLTLYLTQTLGVALALALNLLGLGDIAPTPIHRTTRGKGVDYKG